MDAHINKKGDKKEIRVKKNNPEVILEYNDINFVVLRDMVIANIFAASLLKDGTALVKINYTTPKYRDYKIGKFLFQKEKQFLLGHGIHRLVYTHVYNKKHEAYLVKMGFRKELVNDQTYYYKDIR